MSTFKSNQNSSDYSVWTVDKLKVELARRGAKTTGRKAELIQRLEDYERNQDFQAASVSTPAESPMPYWPDANLFRSLTPAHQPLLPKIEKSQISQYILYRQCSDQKESNVRVLNFDNLMIIY